LKGLATSQLVIAMVAVLIGAGVFVTRSAWREPIPFEYRLRIMEGQIQELSAENDELGRKVDELRQIIERGRP
jgi:hypothetical protein